MKKYKFSILLIFLFATAISYGQEKENEPMTIDELGKLIGKDDKSSSSTKTTNEKSDVSSEGNNFFEDLVISSVLEQIYLVETQYVYEDKDENKYLLGLDENNLPPRYTAIGVNVNGQVISSNIVNSPWRFVENYLEFDDKTPVVEKVLITKLQDQKNYAEYVEMDVINEELYYQTVDEKSNFSMKSINVNSPIFIVSTGLIDDSADYVIQQYESYDEIKSDYSINVFDEFYGGFIFQINNESGLFNVAVVGLTQPSPDVDGKIVKRTFNSEFLRKSEIRNKGSKGKKDSNESKDNKSADNKDSKDTKDSKDKKDSKTKKNGKKKKRIYKKNN